ncbi:MAG: class I SAM-dependent methyltransferase, partial [Myxococcales bacterium]|nr:class I SAM-dependent methyltransferase [Myxococcales bacterium]
MHRFWDPIIRPIVDSLHRPKICEIGSQAGDGTLALLEYVATRGGFVHFIDPERPHNWEALQRYLPEHGLLHEKPSLEVLPDLEPCDVYLIDGDHNHYTVFSELAHILGAERLDPPLIFLHDVEWPYGRRDLYYAPDGIPLEVRNVWLRRGIRPGEPQVASAGGLNPHLAHAVVEGGPKNGVRTAVEDALASAPGWSAVYVRGLHGLAVLHHRNTNPETVRRIQELEDMALVSSSYVSVIEEDRLQRLVQTAELSASVPESYRDELSEARLSLQAAKADVRTLEGRSRIWRGGRG